MKYLTFLFLIAMSCHKDKCDTDLPACIDTDQIKSVVKTIRTQTVNGERHYWLNTDFNQFDGAEFIVNQNCDTVCVFCGECNPPPCTLNYKYEAWKQIWP
jgi:hypothetical protein